MLPQTGCNRHVAANVVFGATYTFLPPDGADQGVRILATIPIVILMLFGCCRHGLTAAVGVGVIRIILVLRDISDPCACKGCCSKPVNG